jgi:hypothetical protein
VETSESFCSVGWECWVYLFCYGCGSSLYSAAKSFMALSSVNRDQRKKQIQDRQIPGFVLCVDFSR